MARWMATSSLPKQPVRKLTRIVTPPDSSARAIVAAVTMTWSRLSSFLRSKPQNLPETLGCRDSAGLATAAVLRRLGLIVLEEDAEAGVLTLSPDEISRWSRSSHNR